jgi:hypothetical protein
MERAKRLERKGQISQPSVAPDTCKSEVSPGALRGAHEEILSDKIGPACASSSNIATDGDVDLHDVIAAWSELNPKLKAAILAIARAS